MGLSKKGYKCLDRELEICITLVTLLIKLFAKSHDPLSIQGLEILFKLRWFMVALFWFSGTFG